tara:strand:- start:1945 stop:2754 length:810 start_codon:yes stop_codon:yes gene_type:complete
MAINFSNANLTLAQMRAFVGELSDLDIGFDENDDISTDLVNGFIKEGFQKVVALSNRWPYYQTTYSLAVLEGIRPYTSFLQTQPTVIGSNPKGITDISQIISVVNSDSNYSGNSLIYLDQAKCESIWVGASDQQSSPAYYSVWADQLNIWPLPDNNYSFTIRGFRNPSLTWMQNEGDPIDISPQLQLPLINYVMARIFQFQEDTEMSNEYMRSFERAIAIIQGNLTAPSSNRQLIMSGGLQLQAYDFAPGNYGGMQVIPGSPYPGGIAI